LLAFQGLVTGNILFSRKVCPNSLFFEEHSEDPFTGYEETHKFAIAYSLCERADAVTKEAVNTEQHITEGRNICCFEIGDF
jgi:hypothetical protein